MAQLPLVFGLSWTPWSYGWFWSGGNTQPLKVPLGVGTWSFTLDLPSLARMQSWPNEGEVGIPNLNRCNHPSFTQISSVLAAAVNARMIWKHVDKEPLWLMSVSMKKVEKEIRCIFTSDLFKSWQTDISIMPLDYLQNSVLFITSKAVRNSAHGWLIAVLQLEWWTDSSKVWSNATTTDCGRCFCAGFSRRSVSLGDVFLLSMLFF